MIAWLTDTLIMTGALMALILLVRRPVGRWFGPSSAYALWALPMIRLLLPPLVLPQSLAFTPMADAMTPQAEPIARAATSGIGFETAIAPAARAAVAFELPWGLIALVVWLGGAAVFLALRAISYHAMRRELLRDSRTIGRSGAIRIIESSSVQAPVAFGVFDRVVALPQGFLATADSDVSDFAITHELEHHAGNDLIANMAVQPLFALHWFNPIGWMAWRALRSDQEAACDARVMAGRPRHDRERYGRLIASFAAGSRFALAAPMAGPLKGDKPIIHRLKALVRNDVPERNRVLGRSLFAASVIAVPMTASVTYAAQELSEPRIVDSVPSAPGEAVPATEPEPPAPPARPVSAQAIVTIEDHEGPEGTGVAMPSYRRTVTRAGRTFNLVTSKPLSDDEADRTISRALAEDWRAQAAAAQAEKDARRAEAEALRLSRDGERMAREAQARIPRVEQSFSADGKVQTLRFVSYDRDGRQTVARKMVIDASCPADRQPRPPAVADGALVESRVCTGAPRRARHVSIALRQARASVAVNAHLPGDVRSEILSDLDAEIADAGDDE